MKPVNPPALQALRRPANESRNKIVLPVDGGANASGRPAVERDYLSLKGGNRVPYFQRPWVIFPLTGALWGLIIWAALWIGGAV